ncbi:MAG: YniB family protein [Plesiomonas sp.]|uniref:YniB family protein n=1 Tax=Plesiomonas sp. TaxID=2486279 RepID=UPI003F2BF99A
MNYKNAVILSASKRLIGWILVIIAVISTAISILKFLSIHIDNGTMASAVLADPYKQFFIFIYSKTQFLSSFWNSSPTPDHTNLTSSASIGFFAIYILIFVASAVKNSGAKLSERLAKTRDQIDDQLMQDQIGALPSRSKKEIRETLIIPNYPVLNQLMWELIPLTITSALLFGFYKMFGF